MISLDEIKKKADPGYKAGRNHIDMGHPLSGEKVMDALSDSYSIYYDFAGANTESPKFKVTEGFDAEARFDSKGEQYFLIKAAKVADIRSAEYVYFKKVQHLTAGLFTELDNKAWETGMAKVTPGPDHKNTDVVLVIVADTVDEDAERMVKKASHSKNYKFALHGYSNYRLVAVELEKGIAYFNNQARILMKLFGNILNEEKEKQK
ncbi:MAG: hypothetical protein K6A38_11150 [Lachnospiraceae bacterium]|nr:hypothetical protein [Lachnospiraceae bacterium]